MNFSGRGLDEKLTHGSDYLTLAEKLERAAGLEFEDTLDHPDWSPKLLSSLSPGRSESLSPDPIGFRLRNTDASSSSSNMFDLTSHPQYSHTFKRYTSFFSGNPSWAHGNEMEMAQCGFFYSPTKTAPERCICFHCGKMVESWKSKTSLYKKNTPLSPLKKHLRVSPSCKYLHRHFPQLFPNLPKKPSINYSKMTQAERNRALRKQWFQTHWRSRRLKGTEKKKPLTLRERQEKKLRRAEYVRQMLLSAFTDKESEPKKKKKKANTRKRKTPTKEAPPIARKKRKLTQPTAPSPKILKKKPLPNSSIENLEPSPSFDKKKLVEPPLVLEKKSTVLQNPMQDSFPPFRQDPLFDLTKKKKKLLN